MSLEAEKRGGKRKNKGDEEEGQDVKAGLGGAEGN